MRALAMPTVPFVLITRQYSDEIIISSSFNVWFIKRESVTS